MCREVPERVLVVRMPPRHGKSELISHWTPTWFEANWPDRNVLLASYEADYAASWGRKARDQFINATAMAEGWLPGVISPSRQATNDWGTTAGGYMATAGVGGPFTGKGFHLGICDDLIKNSEQAQSETYRRKTWEWLTSTFWTRREPEGVMVAVGTPWHRDDWLARLRDWEEPVREINLPAVCESDNDPLGRKPGDALWRDRFDEADLESIRLAQGPYYWNALYQQRPSQHEAAEWDAAYFEDIWYDRDLSADETLCKVMSLDPSLGRTDKSDFSAFIKIAFDRKGDAYVDADLRRRDTIQMVDDGLAHYRAFQPDAWAVEVNGFLALEELIYARAGISVPRIARVTQHANKLARIRLGVGPYLANRRIKFRRGSKGAQLLVDQLKDFPLSDHDDGPDALETALRTGQAIIAGGMNTDDTPQRVYA